MSRPSGVFKESYLADMGFIQKRFHLVGLLLLFAFLSTLPLYAGDFYTSLFMLIFTFSVAIMGLNLLTAAGLFSVSTAALMGVGAFTASFLSQPPLSLPFFIVIPLSGIATMAVASVFALPALRIKGYYMLFLTTATQFTIEWILNYITKNVPGSVVYIAPMSILGHEFGMIEKYYVFLAIATIMGYLIAHIGRTPLGKAIVMIGEKDYAAHIFGVSPLKYKAIAFAIYGLYAGVGGAMWGYQIGLATPEHFGFMLSWEMLGVGVIVGGVGSYVWGSCLGTVVMIAISQGITIMVSRLSVMMPWLGPTAFGLRAILYGVIIAGILIAEPHGLASLLRKVKRFFDLFPFSY